MNKRLRKKKHQGEFAEWGCQIVVKRDRMDGFDVFMNAFIAEAIEANGCFCGGGGKDDTLDVVVELGRLRDHPEEKLRRIKEWFEDRRDVDDYRISEMFDVWHGNYEDIAEQISQE